MRKYLAISLAVLTMLMPAMAGAQLNSAVSAVPLSFTLAESLTLNVVSPSPLVLGTAPTTFTVSATYNLAAARTFIATVPYFSSTAVALSDGTDTITAAQMREAVDSGSANTCGLTNASFSPMPGAECTGIRDTIGSAKSGTTPVHTFALWVESPNFPAGNYTGVLNIAAQAD